jgi:hypothetical protein
MKAVQYGRNAQVSTIDLSLCNISPIEAPDSVQKMQSEVGALQKMHVYKIIRKANARNRG